MSGGSAIISGKWWEIGRISPGEWERTVPAYSPLLFFSTAAQRHEGIFLLAARHEDTKEQKKMN